MFLFSFNNSFSYSLYWSLTSMLLYFHSDDATTHVFSLCEAKFTKILIFILIYAFYIVYYFSIARSFYSICYLCCCSRFALQLQLLLLLSLRKPLFFSQRAKKIERKYDFILGRGWLVDDWDKQELNPTFHGHGVLRHIVWVTLKQAADYFRLHVKDCGMKVAKQCAVSIETLHVFDCKEIR